MMTLIRVAEKNKIIIDEYDFKGHYLGLYFRMKDMPPMIFLDRKLSLYSAVTRCILAEELGHHFTQVGNTVCKHINYGNSLNVTKLEKAALRWAGHVLVPDNLLHKEVNKNPSLYELSRKFNVTEEFMKVRLKIFNEEGYWEKNGTLYQRLNAKETTRQLAGSFNSF